MGTASHWESGCGLDEDVKQESRTKSEAPSTATSNELPTPPARTSTFLFINTNERAASGKHNDESRMLVRSHVMSTFYHKKNSRQDEDSEFSRSVKPSQVVGKTSKFRLESYPQRRKGRRRQEKSSNPSVIYKEETPETPMSSPQCILGSGHIDPFNVVALPWDSHMQSLVRHYVADIPDSIHPLKYNMYHVQNFILKMAITDEGLLHSILAYSMIHKFCFGTSVQPSDSEKIHFATANPEVLVHQTRAMHFVNMKLGTGDVCNMTIATVLILLWHHPWIRGAGEREAHIHYTGLQNMVKFRGGLVNLPEPLSNSITFHDLKRSMLTLSAPKMAIGSQKPADISEIAVPLKNKDSIFFRSPTFLRPLLGTELWDILFSLNQFTDFVSYYRSQGKDFGSEKSVLFEHWNSSLEHRILSYSPPNLGASLCDDSFKEALRTTAGLWMSTGLWSFPLSASIVSSMAGHLVDILVDSSVSSWRERFPDMLLWILVIGSCCTPYEGQQRTFLLGHLKYIAGSRDFAGPQDLAKALRSFIYMEGAYTATLALLWKDIAEEGKG